MSWKCKDFQGISLSQNTVAERVTDLAGNLNYQIKTKASHFSACEYGYPWRMLSSCISCDAEFNIFEELLEMVMLYDITTGEGLFSSVGDLSLLELSFVAMDEDTSITRKNNGFVTKLQAKQMQLMIVLIFITLKCCVQKLLSWKM